MDYNFLIYIGFGLAAIIVGWMIRMELRFRHFLKGGNGKSLEDVIVRLGEELKGLHLSQNELQTYLETVERRLKRSVQNVGITRFNPFKDAGGDQSFAIALLNEDKDGVIFSSFYSRDNVRVYAKPIKNGVSSYHLSPEEEQAIKKALAV